MIARHDQWPRLPNPPPPTRRRLYFDSTCSQITNAVTSDHSEAARHGRAGGAAANRLSTTFSPPSRVRYRSTDSTRFASPRPPPVDCVVLNASASQRIACQGSNSYASYVFANPTCTGVPPISSNVSIGTCAVDNTGGLFYTTTRCVASVAPYPPGFTRGVVVNVYAGSTCNASLPIVSQDK